MLPLPTATREEQRMRRRTRWIAAAGLAVAIAGAVAAAATDGDSDHELTGSTRDRAVAAALAATGGGTVLDTEAGDDGAAYSVEVRLGDGRQLEINLDPAFELIAQEPDDDTTGEDGSR
jgi:Peptidase propeptide and YPEB domain